MREFEFGKVLSTMWVELAAMELYFEQIVCDPYILGGMPVFKGTRVPVDTVLAYMQSGASAQDIAHDFDGIGKPQLEAALIWQQVHPRRGMPPAMAKTSDWKLVVTTSIPRKKRRAIEAHGR